MRGKIFLLLVVGMLGFGVSGCTCFSWPWDRLTQADQPTVNFSQADYVRLPSLQNISGLTSTSYLTSAKPTVTQIDIFQIQRPSGLSEPSSITTPTSTFESNFDFSLSQFSYSSQSLDSSIEFRPVKREDFRLRRLSGWFNE